VNEHRSFLYYPGCTLFTRARALDIGARKAAALVGVELTEMRAWTCCGAICGTNSDDLAGRLSAVRNLARASQSSDKLVTLCAACYNVFKRASVALADPEQAETSRRLLDYVEEPYDPRLKVVHFLEVLRDDIGWDKLRRKVRRPLDGLKVASYYGCLLVRPQNVLGFDDATNPAVLDDLMQTLGAEPANFDFKTACCGGYLVVSRRDVAVRCSRRIIDNALLYGAELVTTSCPLCHYNLDALQEEMKKQDPGFKPVPILYFSKLLGLAMGLDEKELALEYSKVDPRPVLDKYGLLG
jgi:heterodisulfide reductase subunit B